MRLTAGGVGALALLGFALLATPAAAAPMLPRLAPCVTDADQALCLLRLAAADDGGSSIWRDEDLRARPELLARVGVTADTVAGARRADEVEQTFFGPMDQAQAAVARTLSLDHAGRPPPEALAPILLLSTRPPDVPPFFAPQGPYPSARQEAWLQLFRVNETVREPQPGPALARLAAETWERELAQPGLSRNDRSAARGLAQVWDRLGDPAGVARALALLPDPIQRVHALMALGRTSEATSAALALTLDDGRAAARAEFAELVARMSRFDPGAARATPAREEIEDLARSKLDEAYDSVLTEGARTGAAAARPLADRLLDDPGVLQNRVRFATVLKAASPERATARLDGLERQLFARHDAELLAPLVAGWRAVGQPARADAVITRAMTDPKLRSHGLAQILLADGRTTEAAAFAEVSAEDLLKSDLKAGRGLFNFDTYAVNPKGGNGLVGLVVGCSYGAREAKAFDLLDDCAERHRRWLTAPSQKLAGAQSAIENAAYAADAGEVATARRLLAIAVEDSALALAADPKLADWPEGGIAPQLIRIAKAELRADGRLPKTRP